MFCKNFDDDIRNKHLKMCVVVYCLLEYVVACIKGELHQFYTSRLVSYGQFYNVFFGPGELGRGYIFKDVALEDTIESWEMYASVFGAYDYKSMQMCCLDMNR